MNTDSRRPDDRRPLPDGLSATVRSHFWFKGIGATAFITLFFQAYFYLLRHPAHPVTLIPVTDLDRLVGIEPLAMPVYLSLWFYLTVPMMLMCTRRAIVDYGLWAGGLALTGLTIFYFWPTAIPPSHVDWAQYPGLGFLKGIDAAGNACPSLHVATAAFACFWLDRQLRAYGFGRRSQGLNLFWCAGIVYSTMATKQHLALDVAGGIALALVFVALRTWTVPKGIESACRHCLDDPKAVQPE